MTSTNLSVAISSRLAGLEEITHELSTTVSMTMNILVTAETDEPEKACEHLGTATQLSIRSTGALQKLMWELRLLRQLVGGNSQLQDEEECVVVMREG